MMSDRRIWEEREPQLQPQPQPQPLHGRPGVLADDGERAQCHVCGGFYGNLSGHVRQVHGIPPQEYKERYGLKAGTGLIGPALKEVRRQQAEARKTQPAYEAFMVAGAAARATTSPEERRAKARGWRMRLEQRLDPNMLVTRRASLARANAVLQQRIADGTHRPAGFTDRDPKALSALGHARLAELRANPEWRREFARKVSEARGGRLEVSCVICGTSFVEPHSHRRRQTCSSPCLGELKRRMAQERRTEPAAALRRRVGGGIRAARRDRGLSLERLAALAQVSPAHLSRIERGFNVPSGAALERIARALGIEPRGLETSPVTA